MASIIRRMARRARRGLSSLGSRVSAEPVPGYPLRPTPREREIERFLRSLDLPDHAVGYLEENMRRIVRTLCIVPPPTGSGRVLELGAYMQMTPALQLLLGYPDVRGAYFGPLGETDVKTSTIDGKEAFRCEIDLFNAERDRFPYEDNRFETVLACEIIEHLLQDPMHMLLEIHRVLEPEGTLVLTTPNATGYTALVRVLDHDGSPQLYSKYPNPAGEGHETEVPHVREYAPKELRECAEAAGFEVRSLETELIGTFDPTPLHRLLRRLERPTELRGELMFCLGTKRTAGPITRYPSFLYDA